MIFELGEQTENYEEKLHRQIAARTMSCTRKRKGKLGRSERVALTYIHYQMQNS